MRRFLRFCTTDQHPPGNGIGFRLLVITSGTSSVAKHPDPH